MNHLLRVFAHKNDMMRLAIFTTACFLHLASAAQTASVQPINPEGWAKEQAFFTQRRAEFLDHVKGAKNLIVAKGWDGVTSIVVGYDGIRDWKINWPVQRAFCTRIARVVFKNQQQMSFPEPNYSLLRDPAEELTALRFIAYPTCQAYKYSPAGIAHRKKQQEEIQNSVADWLTYPWSQFRKYSEKQFTMTEWISPPSEKSRGQEVMRELSIEYSAGLDERGCHRWGGRFQDHNKNRDDNSKVVAAVIDGEFVFFEFGTYNDETGIASEEKRKKLGDWWGKPGQRYLLATGARHNLNGSDSISSGAFPSARGIEPYDFGNACVINFDTAPTGTANKKLNSQ
jgi:hypothetical protein